MKVKNNAARPRGLYAPRASGVTSIHKGNGRAEEENLVHR